VRHELGVNGSIKNIYIFTAVAIFVLLIACLNFVNLATARAADRAKEVGIRKVSGAHKFALVRQFLGESLLTVALAMGLAIALVEFLLPEFNTIVNRSLDLRYFQNWLFSLGLVGVVIFIGILSGIYPAFFLSSFQPVRVLRSTVSSGAKNITLRKSLVVLQFFISITLIIGTTIILQQVDYLLHKDLGYNSDQILTIGVTNTTPEKNNLFRNEILSNPRVLNAGISDYMPHSSTNWTGISWEGATEDEWIKINLNYIDRHLMDTYNMTVIQGRGFSREFTSDPGNVVILNETAAKKIGWNDPIGKRINYNVDYRSRTVGGATVVGIVKDYHFLSLHHTITPLMLRLYSKEMTGHRIAVKIAARQIPETISFLEEKYQQIFPEEPFSYRFLDEDFRNMYHEERKTSRVIFYLTLLAIFIACLGLFGLASFSIKQRTKEIGIRKVFGASMPDIVFQLISEFLKLLVLANLVAWPVAYVAMNNWLQNFPYRIQIHFWVFITSGALALLIATVTVIYQAIKAALANPVDAMRYE
jgi:putative ABC transport system permease protein